MSKVVRLFDALESNLYNKKLKVEEKEEKQVNEQEGEENVEEEPQAPPQLDRQRKPRKKKKTKASNEQNPEQDEQERKEKDIGDIERDDMVDEKPDEGETVVSINLNGKIKFLDAREISDIFNVESILQLYKIDDPSNIDEKYGKKIEITMNSPLSDYRDYKYTIKLMEAIGEIQVFRPGFSQAFQAKAPLQNMAGAAQQQLQPGAQGAETGVEEKRGLNISGYIDELNGLFATLVKQEFIDRILKDYAGQ
jgi:hypothetical protein